MDSYRLQDYIQIRYYYIFHYLALPLDQNLNLKHTRQWFSRLAIISPASRNLHCPHFFAQQPFLSNCHSFYLDNSYCYLNTLILGSILCSLETQSSAPCFLHVSQYSSVYQYLCLSFIIICVLVSLVYLIIWIWLCFLPPMLSNTGRSPFFLVTSGAFLIVLKYLPVL